MLQPITLPKGICGILCKVPSITIKSPGVSIGDFNVILGAHEYDGSFSPARGMMDDFANWTNQNHLFHMPTTYARFNWSNGGSGA